jgi:hypothetical protein
MIYNSFNIKGRWWVPGKSEEVWDGSLSYSQAEGYELHIDSSYRGSKKIDVILGTLTDNKEVTLLDIYISHKGRTTKFKILTVFIGHHFEDINQIYFDSIDIHHTLINIWAKSMTSNSMKIDGGYELSFSQMLYEDLISISTPIEPDIYMSISKSKTLLVEYEEHILYIENILSLLTDDVVYPLVTLGNIETESNSKKVQILRTFSNYIKDKKTPSVFMYITGSSLSIDLLADTFNKWINFNKKHSNVCAAFIESQMTDNAHYAFLCIVQALEAYHRYCISNQKLPKEEYISVIATAVQAVAEKHREWVEGRLKGLGNTPSLAERIDELIMNSDNILDPFFDDKGVFISKVKDSRNYYTHFAKSKYTVLDIIELINIRKVLVILMQWYLLGEIGFPIEMRKQLFIRNFGYSQRKDTIKI